MIFSTVSEHLLPLQGTANTRDLGGYPTLDNRVTKQNVFFRSDTSSNFLPEDITFLIEKGLGYVIDLRSNNEVDKQPSKVIDTPSLSYKQISMIGDLSALAAQKGHISSMAVLYQYLLDEAGDSIAEVFHIFAETLATGHSCLFHCAVGKDRTGTIAMLLLKLAGVSDKLIIEDYAITEELMKEVFASQREECTRKNIDVPDFLFSSAPKNMEVTLQHLADTYGTAQDYLLSVGVSQEELQVILDRFVVDMA
jgi:Protein tyrosine/serine phosphatase